MTKSELISSISKRYPNLSPKDVQKLVEIVFGQFTEALSEGNRVEIRGFGSISVRRRASRAARNPKTNETVPLEERNVVYFRLGKDFFNKLNPVNAN